MAGDVKRGRPSGRPRIRTIKPEQPHDDKVSRLSMKAELLYIRLITWADDEGRFDASTNAVAGFAFPRRKISPSQVRKLMKEIADVGLILLYKCDGFEYGVHPNWRQHQVISRPTPSLLPEPPDPEIVRANGPDTCNFAVDKQWKNTEESVQPRAGAHAPAPVPVPVVGEEGTVVARADALPDGFPVALVDRATVVLSLLLDAHREPAAKTSAPPTLRRVGMVLARLPEIDHVALAHELHVWTTNPKARQVRDLVGTYSSWASRREKDRLRAQPMAHSGDWSRFDDIPDYGAEAA